ncbi:MAG: molybdopterin molybdotransferase MoeA [Gammaproteobacteria bacterium]|nr:molybdopterin molybdotransferase MoeA [Gammaproteobacteria bacterium]
MSGCESGDCGCDTIKVDLIPYDQALENLLSFANNVENTDIVSLTEALNRTLAEDLKSAINVPPAANSAMDGYAIRLDDVKSGETTTLKVSQRIPAGEIGEPVAAGTAARIFTGAVVPADADVVIMQEQVEAAGDNMSFDADVKRWQNIRAAGEDISEGQTILQKGTRLRAQDLGLAASIGTSHFEVTRKVRVGIFFTGDELIEPGKPLEPGKIYDSNRYTLTGLLQNMGCEIVDLGIVGDTFEQTTKAIMEATETTDLVITSGGVSVGEEDHVRIALEKLGELHMWRLKIKPGKPLAFGIVNDTAFMGLPGNPVSAFATFCLFVAPFIKKLQGRTKIYTESTQVMANFEWPKPDRRREFTRAKITRNNNNQLQASLYPNQGSGVLMSTSWADGFVDIAEDTTVTSGDQVNYMSFKDILE